MPGSWNQVGSDIDGVIESNSFGQQTAASYDGSIIAIGAVGTNGTGATTTYYGSVTVLERSGTSWVQKGSIISGTESAAAFATRISISADGTTIAVGAPNSTSTDIGSVRVYKWNTLTSDWVQMGPPINGEADYDSFGDAIQISADGLSIIIGSKYNDSNSNNNNGSATVYSWNSTTSTWGQKGAKLVGYSSWDLYGISVTISADGNTVAVGAQWDDPTYVGYVTPYYWTGTAWAKKGADIYGTTDSENFGDNVSISADGNRLAIGASRYYVNGGVQFAGRIRVYDWNSTTSSWGLVGQQITGAQGEYLGAGLQLAPAGNRLVTFVTYQAKVRMYEYISGTWTPMGSDIQAEGVNDYSGNLSFSQYGDVLVIGRPGNDGPNGDLWNQTNEGHVRVFSWVGPLDTPVVTTNGNANGDITVSWGPVAYADSYGVQKSSDGGSNWGTEIFVSALTYTFSGLTANSSYSFRVRALPAEVDTQHLVSGYSSTASRVSYLAPAAPTGISATASGSSVNLTITAPTDFGGSSLESYYIQVTRGGIARQFSITANGYTYDLTNDWGILAYNSASAPYALRGVPVDGLAYTIHAYTRAASGIVSASAVSTTVTLTPITEVISTNISNPTALVTAIQAIVPEQLVTLTAAQVESVITTAAVVEVLTLPQIAALPTASVVELVEAATTTTEVNTIIEPLKTAITTQFTSLLAETSTGTPVKADIDSSITTLVAAQIAAVDTASGTVPTVSAITVPQADLTSINTSAPVSAAVGATAIVTAAAPPVVVNGVSQPVRCILTVAQENSINAGGQLYIAGSTGDKLMFVSEDGARSVTVEFPTASSIRIDGVNYTTVGTEVSTAFGPITIMFRGSAGLRGPVAGPICFLADAPVLTPTGYKPISAIKAGDKVRTAAGRDVIVKRAFCKQYMASRTNRPYVIPNGSFGALRALPISPNHEVMVPGRGMVKAMDLGLPRMKMNGSFTYYNLELEDWVRDNLMVAGVECESLAPAERIVMSKAEFLTFVRSRYGASALTRLRAVCFETPDGSVLMPKLK